MAQKNLIPALTLIFGSEGGYANDPADPGGATKYGITMATLQAWMRKTNPAAVVTDANVQALTLSTAQEIYEAEYAPPIRFDDLPAGLDYAMLDFAVNSGPARAAKVLQVLVGVTADGIVGAKTLAAVNQMDDVRLINALCDARLAFMKSLKTWGTFGRGWTARVANVRANAIKMAISPSIPPSSQMTVQTASQSIGKANPIDIGTVATPGGKTSVISMIGAAGAAASTAADQLSAYTSWKYVAYAAMALTVCATLAGFAVHLSRLKSGQEAA